MVVAASDVTEAGTLEVEVDVGEVGGGRKGVEDFEGGDCGDGAREAMPFASTVWV